MNLSPPTETLWAARSSSSPSDRRTGSSCGPRWPGGAPRSAARSARPARTASSRSRRRRPRARGPSRPPRPRPRARSPASRSTRGSSGRCRRRCRPGGSGRGSPRRGAGAPRVERLLRRVGGGHLEAGVAEDDPQRAEDLRARRPRPARAASVTAVGPPRPRELDHEARALAGQRLGPDPAAVGLQEAARDREPEARARRRPRSLMRWNGSKIRSSSSCEIPGPWSEIRKDHRLSAARARIGDRLVAREPRRVLEHVRERALELGGVGVDGGSSGSSWTSKPPAGAGTASPRRRWITSSTPTSPGAARALPACSRVRSSRLSTSRESRALSAAITDGQLGARLVGERVRAAGRRRPP